MGLFGIGTYQSIAGGVQVGNGWVPVSQAAATTLRNPYDGVYGGVYGYVLDMRIRAPKQVVHTPAPVISLDNLGQPVVRGYPQVTWAYSTLRPDYWYYLLNIYNQSARQPPGFQYQVLLRYPAPDGFNTPMQALARMDPPVHSFRTVAVYAGVLLRFTYIGQAVLNTSAQILVFS